MTPGDPAQIVLQLDTVLDVALVCAEIGTHVDVGKNDLRRGGERLNAIFREKKIQAEIVDLGIGESARPAGHSLEEMVLLVFKIAGILQEAISRSSRVRVMVLLHGKAQADAVFGCRKKVALGGNEILAERSGCESLGDDLACGIARPAGGGALLAVTLDGKEEERLVLDDRPADGPAKLFAIERRLHGAAKWPFGLKTV